MAFNVQQQQDYADFGELVRHRSIDHHARREGTDRNPGQQVTNDRGQMEAQGDIPKDQSARQADSESEQ